MLKFKKGMFVVAPNNKFVVLVTSPDGCEDCLFSGVVVKENKKSWKVGTYSQAWYKEDFKQLLCEKLEFIY